MIRNSGRREIAHRRAGVEEGKQREHAKRGGGGGERGRGRREGRERAILKGGGRAVYRGGLGYCRVGRSGHLVNRLHLA